VSDVGGPYTADEVIAFLRGGEPDRLLVAPPPYFGVVEPEHVGVAFAKIWDGYVDTADERAAKTMLLQQWCGLAVDGHAGPTTRGVLASLAAQRQEA
jgi:hypothetical protein